MSLSKSLCNMCTYKRDFQDTATSLEAGRGPETDVET